MLLLEGGVSYSFELEEAVLNVIVLVFVLILPNVT